MTLLLVLLGGACGAVLRYLADRALQAHEEVRLPWGTLAVNVAGSLLLGVLAGAGSRLPGWLGALVGVGFCGALTTYSTFSYETVRLAVTGRSPYALLNVALTMAAGIGAAAVGWTLVA